MYEKHHIINYLDPQNLLNKVSEIKSKSPDQQKAHVIKTLTEESWFKMTGFIRKNVEGFIEFLWWSKCFEQLTEKKIAKKCVNKSARLQGIFCMRLHTEDIVKL